MSFTTFWWVKPWEYLGKMMKILFFINVPACSCNAFSSFFNYFCHGLWHTGYLFFLSGLAYWSPVPSIGFGFLMNYSLQIILDTLICYFMIHRKTLPANSNKDMCLRCHLQNTTGSAHSLYVLSSYVLSAKSHVSFFIRKWRVFIRNASLPVEFIHLIAHWTEGGVLHCTVQ